MSVGEKLLTAALNYVETLSQTGGYVGAVLSSDHDTDPSNARDEVGAALAADESGRSD